VPIILSLLAVLFTASMTFGQEQDRKKLIDRLFQPNLSLVNPAQGQDFNTPATFPTPQISAKSFHPPGSRSLRPFLVQPNFTTTQFATSRFLVKSERVKTTILRTTTSPSSSVASENDKAFRVMTFPGSRSFSDQGSNQKRLSAQERPLTIEQVRKLLNRNK
jgi:hypothetical protein